jgi:hypothetical protein
MVTPRSSGSTSANGSVAAAAVIQPRRAGYAPWKNRRSPAGGLSTASAAKRSARSSSASVFRKDLRRPLLDLRSSELPRSSKVVAPPRHLPLERRMYSLYSRADFPQSRGPRRRKAGPAARPASCSTAFASTDDRRAARSGV